MSSADIIIIIPTYNEAENIAQVIEACLKLPLAANLLIVDDNSPDGTSLVASALARTHKSVSVVLRRSESGLGLALYTGYRWAREHGFTTIVNMDADLSHNTADIPRLCFALQSADLVIGSRYLRDSRREHWPIMRFVLSRAGAFLVNKATSMPFSDPTSGFRAFNAKALDAILNERIVSRGFSFHFEVLCLCWRGGLRIAELPITFTQRRRGRSKLSYPIVVESLKVAVRLGFNRELHERKQLAIRSRPH